MTRNRELPQFEILAISKDDNGRYAKIKAVYPDGEIIIRWGLDSLTYVNFKDAFAARIFDKMPNLNYEYKLLTFYSSSRNPDETRDYSGFIECILGKQIKQIEFKCSEIFAGNIKWMSEVKSCEELNHLKWMMD
ncbi:hypothetical protein AWH56_018180 [Anaerobacillus isosaccharinicus]|uniref:Uncharacterized protein n=1 Tax=Anaerobacillus isosaccharinicus TaxID=1532552 RepID=A0A1S2M426_9BACI|nr:hypothetical protein [Anaerobacillus isosaccharinicus]MBA5587166.1 hypothetical protein [Anaerobacillus isosaccharinicus]QOY34638.1 hypothetical protein AWH56_018180 [Anaerobacillus isosaccharinicus]